MKPPHDHPYRILTPERSIVAQELMDYDQPIPATELNAEIDDIPMSELLEHLRVLCAAGIIIEPVPRRYEIRDSGVKLLRIQARIERVTQHPHI